MNETVYEGTDLHTPTIISVVLTDLQYVLVLESAVAYTRQPQATELGELRSYLHPSYLDIF